MKKITWYWTSSPTFPRVTAKFCVMIQRFAGFQTYKTSSRIFTTFLVSLMFFGKSPRNSLNSFVSFNRRGSVHDVIFLLFNFCNTLFSYSSRFCREKTLCAQQQTSHENKSTAVRRFCQRNDSWREKEIAEMPIFFVWKFYLLLLCKTVR